MLRPQLPRSITERIELEKRQGCMQLSLPCLSRAESRDLGWMNGFLVGPVGTPSLGWIKGFLVPAVCRESSAAVTAWKWVCWLLCLQIYSSCQCIEMIWRLRVLYLWNINIVLLKYELKLWMAITLKDIEDTEEFWWSNSCFASIGNSRISFECWRAKQWNTRMLEICFIPCPSYSRNMFRLLVTASC